MEDDSFIIGDVVYINGEGDWRGKLCFIGQVHFAKGDWAGVALDHPMGNHDGVAHNRRYFQCPANHGIFTRVGRLSNVMKIPETMDVGKYGLRNTKVFEREYEKTPPPAPPVVLQQQQQKEITSIRKSPVRETSPFASIRKSPVRETSPFATSKTVSFSNNHQNNSNNDDVKIGDRVIVKSVVGETKAGVLRYLGKVDFEEGIWAGIELSHPLGKNDGTIRGREYFRCQHPFGLFVPANKIEYSPANKTLGKRMGTRENLYAVMAATRGVRAGSFEEYY